MLPKEKRLRTEDFKEFKGAYTSHTPHFIFRAKRGTSTTRIAAVVGAAVAKKAVDRNKLRRRMYEAVESLWVSVPQATFFSITAKKGALALSFKDLRKEIEEGISRANSLK